MKKLFFAFLTCSALSLLVRADQTNIAEDDASREAYNGGFDSGKKKKFETDDPGSGSPQFEKHGRLPSPVMREIR